MNDDTLKALWTKQKVDPFLPGEAQIDKVRQNAHRFDRAIYWRDMREIIVCLAVVIIFGVFYFLSPSWVAKLGCIITIAASVFSCGYMEWKKRRVKPEPFDASVVEALQFELRKLQVQIDLLRSIFWWYLLPLAVGPTIFFFGVSRSTEDRLFYVLLVVAINVFLYYLNRRTVTKSLVPLQQQLITTLSADAPAASKSNQGMVAPVRAVLVSLIILLGILAFIFGAEKGTVASFSPDVRDKHGNVRSLESIRMKYNFPALAAAFVKDGIVIEAETIGYRKAGGTESVSADDRFHIASVTKSMTATVAAMLVEQGNLSWTTTIAESFPELKGHIHPQYSSVTLEQLLAHRGGAPGTSPKDLWKKAWEAEGTPAEQRMEFAKGILTRKPEARPGTKHIYSNQGYAIAGVMLEKASGKTWEVLMQSMLFDPLGMTSAGFGAPATPGKVDQPWGHEAGLIGQVPVPPGPAADNPLAISPSGGVHCSIADLAKYAAFHLAGARGEGILLKPETFRKLHTSAGDDYALGWTILDREWAGGKALWHNGSNTMFYALVWIAPERNCAAVAAANVGGDKAFKACDDAVTDLLRKFGYLEP